MYRTLSAIAFSMVMLCGCSIKTDRSDCPCLLNVDVCGGLEKSVDLYCWTGDKTFTAHSILEGDGTKECFVVGRGMSSFLAMSGMHSCVGDGKCLRIPFGSEMDEIYAFSTQMDTDCDCAEVRAEMHRQFVFLYVSVKGSESDDYPYGLKLTGNTCGFDMRTLEPLEGPFSVSTRPYLGNCCRICIPRQRDDSLTMLFIDGQVKGKGAPSIGEILLGRHISADGYDWSREDLPDIYVNVDYVKSEINITVDPWEKIEL